MLKHLFRTAINYKLPNKFYEGECITYLFFRNNIFVKNYCLGVAKLEQIYTGRFGCQRNKLYSNKQPVVLLSGILSFFGIGSTPEEEEEPLITTIKRGILCIQREQYDKAEQILHVALKMAQDLQDEDGITYVYDVLANLAFQTRQFGKAKKLFTSVLQRLIAKGEPEDSNKVVDISLKIAKIFEETKEFGKAEQGFKFCIETLDNKLNTDDQDTLALWGMSMDWYARFLLDRNKKQEALVCFRKAYEMCVKVNGVVHEQTVVLLNDLGTVASLIGDHESALNYLEKARDIGMSLPEMKDLPAIYINLGQLYLIREMYKESKLACQQGLKLAKQYGDDISVTEANECFNKISSVLKAKEVNKDLPQVPHVAVNQ